MGIIRPMTVVEILRKIRQSTGLLDGGTTAEREIDEVGTQVARSAGPAASTLLRTLGWISAGAGALGLGLVVGRELRQRYKFSRRTPYDFYAHAGDYKGDLEFGVGV